MEQVYKDFTASILNAYKFFETYANVDKWTTDNTSCYYMRTTDNDVQNMLEKILRIDPDIIYTNDKKNAEEISKIMKTYRDKKVKIKDLETEYTKMLQKNPGQNIVVLSDETMGKQLWKSLYGTDISLEK